MINHVRIDDCHYADQCPFQVTQGQPSVRAEKLTTVLEGSLFSLIIKAQVLSILTNGQIFQSH